MIKTLQLLASLDVVGLPRPFCLSLRSSFYVKPDPLASCSTRSGRMTESLSLKVNQNALTSRFNIDQDPSASRFARNGRLTQIPRPLASLEFVGRPRHFGISLRSRCQLHLNQLQSASRSTRSRRYTDPLASPSLEGFTKIP